MKILFNHKLISSFSLFLDHSLLDGAQAYVNVNTGLYIQNNPSINGRVYASPYKSWVYDSCVSGANIPSGVYNSSGQFLTRQSGIVIDFINGRVISNANWGSQLSGNFARKEYNIYTSTEQEFNFWLENVYGEDKSIEYSLTGANSSRFYAPCVILTNAWEENKPFALGGLDSTENIIRAYIISNSSFQQEGINSYFRDLARQYFTMVNFGDVPITSSGDLKSGYYCYNDLCSRYGVTGGFIENCYGMKISQKSNNATSFFISAYEFDTSIIRQPSRDK